MCRHSTPMRLITIFAIKLCPWLILTGTTPFLPIFSGCCRLCGRGGFAAHASDFANGKFSLCIHTVYNPTSPVMSIRESLRSFPFVPAVANGPQGRFAVNGINERFHSGRWNFPFQVPHALVTAPLPMNRSFNSSSGRAPTSSNAQWQTASGFAPVSPLLSVMLS